MRLRTASCALLFVSSSLGQLITVDPSKLPAPHMPTQRVARRAFNGAQPTQEVILELGQGYNALTGDYLPEVCIDKVRDDKEFGRKQVGAGINHEYIDVVSNMATRESASGSSAGFDVTYKLISVGFQTGANSANYYNSIDQFARVYKRLITRGEARVGGAWSNTGKTYIKMRLKDFVQKCGTHYVRALYYGSLVDQTLEFRYTGTKYSSTDRSGFSLGVKGLFGFNYSNTSSQTAVSSSAKTMGVDDSRGLINSIAVPDQASGVQTLVKFAREQFPKDVASSQPDKSALLMVEVVPYSAVAVRDSEKVPDWPNEIQARIQDQGPLYEQFLSAISDLNFAIALPSGPQSDAYADTKDQLQQKLSDALNIQKDFRAAAKSCLDMLKAGVDDETARAQCENGLVDKLTPQLVSSISPSLK